MPFFYTLFIQQKVHGFQAAVICSDIFIMLLAFNDAMEYRHFKNVAQQVGKRLWASKKC